MDNTNDNQLDMRLELMIGKTYKYKDGIVRIEDVRIKGNIARLVTEGAPIFIDITNLDNELKAFKQISDNTLVRDTRIIDSIMYETNVYSAIQGIAFAAIQKINEDKNYIPQANAINDAVKNLIELEKTRISAFALLK